ncbi:hypothetical protein [Sporosarcina sp. A2]|uniref:hypothetical protein n=1 Tax=Sporosarcina sp. A2 TaxID=3393449 RepID=UPI003D78C91D
MKKVLILIISISLFAVLTKANAMINEYDEIAKSNNGAVTIDAKKINGLYTDFKINFQGATLSKPYWWNTTNPAWSPEIIYKDINRDGKNELVIILTIGTGTGILEREAHVFHIERKSLGKTSALVPVEVLVDNPMAILLKNVKTELTHNKASVSINDKKCEIEIKPFGIEQKHLFSDIYFGNLIDFEIKENQLIAKIGGQISPAGGYLGDIQITYVFKDKMYQAKSIEFKPISGVECH